MKRTTLLMLMFLVNVFVLVSVVAADPASRPLIVIVHDAAKPDAAKLCLAYAHWQDVTHDDAPGMTRWCLQHKAQRT